VPSVCSTSGAFGVSDVLNAATGTLKHFAQDSLALGKWPSPNIFSVVHQKIEGESGGRPVIEYHGPDISASDAPAASRVQYSWNLNSGRSVATILEEPMVDNRKKRGRPDRSRIDVNQAYELQYWKKMFGVSGQQLAAAVRRVGPRVKNVAAYLANKRRISGRGRPPAGKAYEQKANHPSESKKTSITRTSRFKAY
jgi:Protein of unknown function (DUF3606)